MYKHNSNSDKQVLNKHTIVIIVINEVEYVGKRYIFGQRSARKQFRPNCLEALANLSFI